MLTLKRLGVPVKPDGFSRQYVIRSLNLCNLRHLRILS